MLLCAADIISIQLQNGILHCTEEPVHSNAVLGRLGDDRRTLYLMRVRELDGELHGACNFKHATLALGMGKPLKILESEGAMIKTIPSFVAEHKIRRVLFDDAELYHRFEQPGLARMMELVGFVGDPPGAADRIGPRFEPSLPAVRPAPQPREMFSDTSSPQKSGCGVIFWVIAGAVILFLLMRAC
jgi:hypothetical protein